MKSKLLLAILFSVITLSSCESSGYLEDGQISTVSVLIGTEWLLTRIHYNDGSEYEYANDTQIYRFENTGKGWIANGSFIDQSKKDNVSYYQWGFTTENFSVIYMAGHAIEGYWLIEKLTKDELWVMCTRQDPVIYPNQTKTFYRFVSRNITK